MTWKKSTIATTALATASLFGATAEKPNVIVILADDLGYGDLSCYGATKIQTPNCDKLATQGVIFTDAHSSSAVCSPTRYGVLTGRYNWRSWLKNWVVHDHMPLLIDTERTTLPKMMQKKGYTTGCIGKWHLGWGRDINADWNKAVKPGPNQVGFDYYFGVPVSHNSVDFLQVFVENDRIVGLKDGEDIHNKKVMKRVQRSMPDTATNLSKKAVQFIEDNKDKPFFMYYPTTNIHFPITPHGRFKKSSKAGGYGDFTVEFDWAIGEIMKSLEKNGLADNTLLIVTSDNGGMPNGDVRKAGHSVNGDWSGIKCDILEGGHRIPFIARWPKQIKPNTKSAETICLTDLMATCAEIVDYRLDNTMAEDSYSILPVLTGKKYSKPLREATVHHSVTGMFAIRKGDWKLIAGVGNGFDIDFGQAYESAKGRPVLDPETGKIRDLYYNVKPFHQTDPSKPAGQLYNLATDPKEKENLWDKHPEVVKELQKMLKKYRTEKSSTPVR